MQSPKDGALFSEPEAARGKYFSEPEAAPTAKGGPRPLESPAAMLETAGPATGPRRTKRRPQKRTSRRLQGPRQRPLDYLRETASTALTMALETDKEAAPRLLRNGQRDGGPRRRPSSRRPSEETAVLETAPRRPRDVEAVLKTDARRPRNGPEDEQRLETAFGWP
mmetsp:Transcript_19797/g.68186  ORF Transcript_19797/g.68186 Transcript_19797/m.68186 type:complete len:166 (+) Transcript_19797:2-499(+)